MTDNAIARSAYANGTDPVDWAVTLAQVQIETAATILITREHTPGAYPQFRGELTAEAVARRIVGELLDAGWTPPTLADRCARCGNAPAPGCYCPDCGRIADDWTPRRAEP
jgi:hypothetical protein